MYLKRFRLIGLAIVLLLGSGCASVKFDTGDDEILKISPTQALNESHNSGAVIWGGQIVSVHNLQHTTELVILSYPLSNGHVPKIDKDSGKRFLAVYTGFLEPLSYAPGRYVSLYGDLQSPVGLMTGEYETPAPAVQVKQIHLWDANTSQWQNRVNFGVGIGVSL